MKKALKWIGIVDGLAGLLILAVAAVYAIPEDHFNRIYPIQVKPVAIHIIQYPSPTASIRLHPGLQRMPRR